MGLLNFLFVIEVLIIYIELLVVLIMHEQTVNPGLIAAFIIASIVFILVTFVVIKPVIVYLQQMKTNIIGNAYKTLVKKNDTYSINCYHWIQTELSFFSPYGKIQSTLLQAFRLLPVGIAIIKLTRFI